MIGERQRRGPGTAFAAVDRDEVDAAYAMFHLDGEVDPEIRFADGGLDADRKAGFRRQQFDEVEHAVDVGERSVPRGASAVLPHRDAADRRDFGGDLRRRQQAAETRLGALAQLDLNRLDGAARDHLSESFKVETAFGVPRAEVGRPQLADQIAAVQMMRRDAAFAGVVKAAGDLGAAVKGLDRGAAEGAKTHPADVDDGCGPEGFGATARGAHDLRARQRVSVVLAGRVVYGKRTLLEDDVVRREVEIVVCAEAEVAVGLLG